jgi:cation:H+ antiporter
MTLSALVFFVCGLAALIVGAEWLVRGAARLAASVGISPLVVGLTVVAFGTSSPELGVSVMSSMSGQAGIAVGNVVGSNICNVLLILGLSALFAPLIVARQLIRIEVPLMVGVSFLFAFMAFDGVLGRLDGILLFGGAIVYTVWVIRRSRRESLREAEKSEAVREGGNPGTTGGAKGLVWQICLIIAGLALLGLGANWLVDAAVAIAKHFGVSDLLIGLTVVAFGTSLPELAASVMASIRGERDIAVGNIVGSNLFNILVVIGLTGIVAPEGVPVAETAIQFDIPVMLAVAAACLPIFFTGHLIARWEGLLFLFYYIAYTLYLILNAFQHQALPVFTTAMIGFFLPLTGITLMVCLVRAYRQKHTRTSHP